MKEEPLHLHPLAAASSKPFLYCGGEEDEDETRNVLPKLQFPPLTSAQERIVVFVKGAGVETRLGMSLGRGGSWELVKEENDRK